MSCPVACWISVPRTCLMREITFRGIAFSCTCFGSMFLYAWYCLERFQSRIPSLSCVGFGCPWLRKAAATLLRVLLTVPAARGASHGSDNLPSWTATAKQLNMCVCLFLVRSVRKMSPVSPVWSQYSFHCFHAQAWSLCVLCCTAAARAVSAAARSAKRQFCWVGVQFWKNLPPAKVRG